MTLQILPNPPRQVIGPEVILGTAYTGPMVVSSAKHTLEDFEFDRLELRNSIPDGQQAKWGILLYNEVRSHYSKLKVSGIDKEHGIYAHSPRGGYTHDGTEVFDVGAQGLQVVYRSVESDTPNGHLETGVHQLLSCSFRRCGQPRGYGRASYAVSFFGYQNGDGSAAQEPWDCPVRIVDTVIEHLPWGEPVPYERRGALLVIGRPRLEVVGGATLYGTWADRPVWKLRGVREVLVTGHEFDSSKHIEIEDLPGQPVERVFFGGCTGRPCSIRVNGLLIGNTSRNVRWSR